MINSFNPYYGMNPGYYQPYGSGGFGSSYQLMQMMQVMMQLMNMMTGGMAGGCGPMGGGSPRGGNFTASTNICAFSGVETNGINIPEEPSSR